MVAGECLGSPDRGQGGQSQEVLGTGQKGCDGAEEGRGVLAGAQGPGGAAMPLLRAF